MSIANNEQPRGCRDDAIKILRSRLRTNLKSGKVLRPSKRFIEFLLQLYANGRSEVIYTEVFKLNIGDLDKVLNSLIRRGYVSAIYIGPPKSELPQPCRNVKGIPKDPWVIDRRKSGAIKVWSFAYTGNERLRKRRRRCWGQYIVLRFTKLLNMVNEACNQSNAGVQEKIKTSETNYT